MLTLCIMNVSTLYASFQDVDFEMLEHCVELYVRRSWFSCLKFDDKNKIQQHVINIFSDYM